MFAETGYPLIKTKSEGQNNLNYKCFLPPSLASNSYFLIKHHFIPNHGSNQKSDPKPHNNDGEKGFLFCLNWIKSIGKQTYQGVPFRHLLRRWYWRNHLLIDCHWSYLSLYHKTYLNWIKVNRMEKLRQPKQIYKWSSIWVPWWINLIISPDHWLQICLYVPSF